MPDDYLIKLLKVRDIFKRNLTWAVMDGRAMMNGEILRVMQDKGYGFIKGEDGAEYFFHKDEFNGFFDDLVEDIEKGRRIVVKFEPVPSMKGPRASTVVRHDGGI